MKLCGLIVYDDDLARSNLPQEASADDVEAARLIETA